MGNPTPKADALRAMREASRGHLHAKGFERTMKGVVEAARRCGEVDAVIKQVKKLMKPGIAPVPPKPARKRKKLKRKIA